MPTNPAPGGELALVATCAVGLEPLLVEELLALGEREVEATKGAVRFVGTWETVWRANLALRTANRVLVELGSWPAEEGAALAAGARKLVSSTRRWGGLGTRELFDPGRTLALRASCRSSRITDPRWAALKVKDGLVDGQRDRFGKRATVARDNPDTALRVLVADDWASLLLDTSGESLDRRGYRVVSGAAPVREQLAAACVLASGWQGTGPVLDPMCGTGTLLAEAGWIALARPPGLLRPSWSFERLPGFARAGFERVRQALGVGKAGAQLELVGVDRAAAAVDAARRNLEQAGLASYARIVQGDGFAFSPPHGPGLLVVNPPYGVRLEEDSELSRRLGDLFKQRFQGWTAVVLAGDAGKGKWIGLKPKRKIPVKNGPLDARILVFELY